METSDDFLTRLRKEDEEIEKSFIKSFMRDARRFLYRLGEIPTNLKWKWQRLVYGYSDCDVCGLNSFILEKVYPPLKEYVKYQTEKGMSTPQEFAKDPAAWLNVLREIEYAFDEIYKDDEFGYSEEYMGEVKRRTEEESKIRQKRIEDGLVYFGRYLRDLWD